SCPNGRRTPECRTTNGCSPPSRNSHGTVRDLSMKVSILGGGGLVGSATAYALQCGGVVSSICLIDANKDMALGQATDLLHGASLVADQRITAGDMGDIPSSNVVIITAGLRRKPDES